MPNIRVYHVGPGRRWLLAWILGPIFLALLVGALLVRGDSAIALLLTAGFLFLIYLPFQLLINWTRLELSSETVRLRQIACRLEAPWSEVVALRLARGGEGLITNEPLRGKGAGRLASVRGFGMAGGPLYDAEQQALMAERRFIPLEAFGWHFRKGTLRADLREFAPHLEELVPPPVTPTSRKQLWQIAAIMIPIFLCVIGLAASPEHIQTRVLRFAGLGFMPLLTLRGAFSAWNSFRARAWFLHVCFVLMTLLLALWSFALWLEFLKSAH